MRGPDRNRSEDAALGWTRQIEHWHREWRALASGEQAQGQLEDESAFTDPDAFARAAAERTHGAITETAPKRADEPRTFRVVLAGNYPTVHLRATERVDGTIEHPQIAWLANEQWHPVPCDAQALGWFAQEVRTLWRERERI